MTTKAARGADHAGEEVLGAPDITVGDLLCLLWERVAARAGQMIHGPQPGTAPPTGDPDPGRRRMERAEGRD